MDLLHFGRNGLLTFPPHTTPVEYLPTAMVTPTVMQEEIASSSSKDSFDWLEDVLLQEMEDEQQYLDQLSLSPYTLEQLLNLSDNEEEMVIETTADIATSTTTTTTPAPIVTTVDTSNAIFRYIDVRLRTSLVPAINHLIHSLPINH